jgi:hypothetical protein
MGAAAVLGVTTVACCCKDCAEIQSPPAPGDERQAMMMVASPMMVTVPPGVSAGQTIQLAHPQTGQQLTVVVPPGVVRRPSTPVPSHSQLNSAVARSLS